MIMISIKTFVFNPFQENTYLVSDETKQGIIIDPGCYFDQEISELKKYVNDNDLKINYIVCTHGHIDHALGMNVVRDTYKAKTILHKGDLGILNRIKDFGATVGIVVDPPREPDYFIEEGEQLKFGNTLLDILHVPGHSPGSIALVNKKENIVFSGDVLFRRGIGRTDLTGGDYMTLIESINEKLLTLSDDAVVYPGHGETTTVKEEREENPLLL